MALLRQDFSKDSWSHFLEYQYEFIFLRFPQEAFLSQRKQIFKILVDTEKMSFSKPNI